MVDAKSYEQAEAAQVTLRSHLQGAASAQFLNAHLGRILVHLVAYDAFYSIYGFSGVCSTLTG